MGVAGWVCSQGWGGLCSLGVWNGTVMKNKVQTTQWRSVWKLQGEVLCNVLKFYPVRSSNRLIRKGPVFLPFAPRKWPKNRMDVHRVCSVFGRLKCIWDLGLSMSFSSEEFDFGLIIFFWWMTRIWVSWVSAVLYTKGVNRPLESVLSGRWQQCLTLGAESLCFCAVTKAGRRVAEGSTGTGCSPRSGCLPAPSAL